MVINYVLIADKSSLAHTAASLPINALFVYRSIFPAFSIHCELCEGMIDHIQYFYSTRYSKPNEKHSKLMIAIFSGFLAIQFNECQSRFVSVSLFCLSSIKMGIHNEVRKGLFNVVVVHVRFFKKPTRLSYIIVPSAKHSRRSIIRAYYHTKIWKKRLLGTRAIIITASIVSLNF